MGENSAIGWTHNTFNLVWGCDKVSEECKNCYAETWARATGRDVWGPKAPRMTLSDPYWRAPLKWNRAAKEAGERRRVFCSSMADVFEDHPTVESQRARLWPLIELTDGLDWLLLTKRPENIMRMVPERWRAGFPPNVWQGTTAGLQKRLDERWPHLRDVPARVRFISGEPLLGPLRPPEDAKHKLSWIILGGESGSDGKRREMDFSAAVDTTDRFQDLGIPIFWKQDSARKSGERGRLSDWMWGLKQFPKGQP